jgi:hypothetical protein
VSRRLRVMRLIRNEERRREEGKGGREGERGGV